jgi:hypothetical protein
MDYTTQENFVGSSSIGLLAEGYAMVVKSTKSMHLLRINIETVTAW